MDRNLKWRTIGLIGLIVFCISVLLPSFAPKNSLPRWFHHEDRQDHASGLFAKKINLGLDLKGGLHIVYSIDLDRAIQDKADEIKRDLDAKFADKGDKDPAWKDQVTVTAPGAPIGTLVVRVKDATKKADVENDVKADFKELDNAACPGGDDAKALCFAVSSAFAEDQREAALHNAVLTIRERIDERGIAEPSVVEKGDSIIVELPGLSKDSIERVRQLIARTAKLEFKIVEDTFRGKDDSRPADPFMDYVQAYAKGDADAKAQGIDSEIDSWTPEDSSDRHSIPFLTAKDRQETVSECEAKEIDCYDKNKVGEGSSYFDDLARSMDVIAKKDDKNKSGGKMMCTVPGSHVLDRYVNGLKKCGIPSLADRARTFYQAQGQKTPQEIDAAVAGLTLPEGRQLGYEKVTPERGAREKNPFWRTYYLDRAVMLSGSAVTRAGVGWDPNTNKPIVEVNFDRAGGRQFGDLTSENVGKKMAIILDDKINSAPIINGPIRGGSCVITMGGNDPDRMQAEADDLVSVLKTGSLPAPLKEDSHSEVGPTLGSDAIAKAQLSFIVGVVLVIVIMLGIYKWSGWIAIGAVTINVGMMMTAMTIFGATLTLPGIAALVLTVGMGVDGNILIYERIRDELTLGKSVKGAVDVGFSRAFTAILDGHMTTAAGGWVLLQYGSGPIKGFAVMLLVGIGTTLFCSTVVTRIFFDWAVARKKGANQTISI